MPRAYYNEIDAAACAILRQQIADGVIMPGDVDARSIKEVTADDLRGYTQCHFFAGGGLWSVAARMAGWPDARPLWTASCPCQPISAAGKRLGADDPRHLWPDLYRILTAARRAGFAAPVLVGEQVAGALGYNWFDGVRADLAAEEIAARTVDFPAGAVDAPQQRNRLYWIAVADDESGRRGTGLCEDGPVEDRTFAANGHGGDRTLVDAALDGRREGCAEPVLRRQQDDSSPGADLRSGAGEALGISSSAGQQRLPITGRIEGAAAGRTDAQRANGRDGGHGDLGHADGSRQFQRERDESGQRRWSRDANARGRNGTHWSDAEWIICHDGKARRAEPGIRLLVNGLPGRVDLWRVGGNAIVPQCAAEVLAAFLEAEAELAA